MLDGARRAWQTIELPPAGAQRGGSAGVTSQVVGLDKSSGPFPQTLHRPAKRKMLSLARLGERVADGGGRVRGFQPATPHA